MKRILFLLLLLVGFATAAQAQSGCVELREIDGTPDVKCVKIIRVTNGTLSCTGTTCTITISGGGGDRRADRILSFSTTIPEALAGSQAPQPMAQLSHSQMPLPLQPSAHQVTTEQHLEVARPALVISSWLVVLLSILPMATPLSRIRAESLQSVPATCALRLPERIRPARSRWEARRR